MVTITPPIMQALRTAWVGNFNTAFAGAKSRYTDIAMVTNSNTSKGAYSWLGQLPFIREWVGPRHIMSLEAFAFAIENRNFETTIEVLRDDIADDNAGTYGVLFSEMGRTAALHPDELVFGLLPGGFTGACYDGQNFFDTDHPVCDALGNATTASNVQAGGGEPWYLLDTSRAVRPLIYQKRMDYKIIAKDRPDDDNVFWNKKIIYGCDGRSNAGYGLWQMAFASKLPLNAENYEAAKASMTSLRGDSGKLLGVRPTVCIVPPTMENTGKSLFKKPNLAGGESNIHDGEVELIIADWLAQ
jgi:phage major head subunit gpT-like protein